jgi:hypothetical protein
MAEDQRPDDERSLGFTSEPLGEGVDVLGRPELRARVRVNRPMALLSARLEDVAPSGEALLVSWDMLNLTHRDSHKHPTAVEVGREYDVSFELRVCGHRFEAGHRIRLAISPTYWPHAWPSPEPVTLELAVGGPSGVRLPLFNSGSETATPEFEPAEVPSIPAPEPGDGASRIREIAVEDGVHEICDRQTSVRTIPRTGARYSESGVDIYRIREGDPLSATVRCERETSSTGAGHDWRVAVASEMTCDADSFFLTETYSAHEGDEQVFARTREHTIPRDHL